MGDPTWDWEVTAKGQDKLVSNWVVVTFVRADEYTAERCSCVLNGPLARCARSLGYDALHSFHGKSSSGFANLEKTTSFLSAFTLLHPRPPGSGPQRRVR